MNSAKNFMAVLGKTGQQVAQDIDEFVQQFAAAKRNSKNVGDSAADQEPLPRASGEEVRQAAAACLAVLAHVQDDVRSAFDAANQQEHSPGRIIEQAEEALRRIVQTQPAAAASAPDKKPLTTAEASGLIIRCRKYWQANTNHPLNLGTLSSPGLYGEFLTFVSEQFEVEPGTLFNREVEIRQREQALKERMKSQSSGSSEITAKQ